MIGPFPIEILWAAVPVLWLTLAVVTIRSYRRSNHQ